MFDLSAGIAHTHLYLDHVLYRCEGARPRVEAVFFLDGD